MHFDTRIMQTYFPDTLYIPNYILQFEQWELVHNCVHINVVSPRVELHYQKSTVEFFKTFTSTPINIYNKKKKKIKIIDWRSIFGPPSLNSRLRSSIKQNSE